MFDKMKPLEDHLNEFIFNSRKPFYNDDSDYTTNAPSYYDDLAKKNKLIKHLAMRIWDYDKEIAKRLAEWDKNLEEFPDEVIKLLEKWLNDGTLKDLVNIDILGRLQDLETNTKVNIVSAINENKQFIDELGVSVKRYGAVGDGVTDDTKAIQETLDKHKNVFFPAGTFKVTETLDIYTNRTIKGSGTQNTYIRSMIRNNGHIFSGVGNSHPDDSFLARDFTIKGYDRLEEGYAFHIHGIINAVLENIYVRDIGGGTLFTTRTSNVTLDKVYMFGCGKNTFYNTPENGVAHIDRSGGFGNTMNLLNCYISNCNNMSGVFTSGGHATRLINTTIESCHTLVHLGDSGVKTRNVNTYGLYLENAYHTQIKMTNIIQSDMTGIYTSTNESRAEYSLDINVCWHVNFNNCAFGDKEMITGSNNRGVIFNNCINVNIPPGSQGVNDSSQVSNLANSLGGFGVAHNLCRNSNDLTENWNGSAVASPLPDGFYDGNLAYRLSKTQQGEDRYFSDFNDYYPGDKLVFSVYLKGGCTLQLRGERMDGTNETIIARYVSVGDWGRVYIATEINSVYKVIRARVSPGVQNESVGECDVAHFQLERGKMEPGQYIETKGIPLRQEVTGTTNGAHYFSDGIILQSEDGLFKNIKVNNNGEIVVTDVDNSFS